MSIEYTIDIQLTEMGFPDILTQQQSSAGGTSSHSPTSLSSGTRKSKRLSNAESEGSEPIKTSTKVTPTESQQDAETTAAASEDESDDSEVSDIFDEEEDDEEEGEGEEEEEEGASHVFPGGHTCSVCCLTFSTKFKLQDHMNLHTGVRPYRCAECGKRFSQNRNYRVHLRTHAQTVTERVLCRVCQMTFASKSDLEDHLSTTHLQDEFYECDRCKRVFTCLKMCEAHVQLHKCMPDTMCKVCGRKLSSLKSLARHQKRTCCGSFKCTDCMQVFSKKVTLLRHSFSHLGLLPYTCAQCHCHFRLAKLYRQHKCQPQSIHCVACLREFLSEEDFQQHKKDTGCWGNQEPKGDEIRCLECGEKFDTTEALKKHAGAHQRVLKCAECGKGFRSALLLMSHMGGHAGKSPCLCQSCGLGFPHQQNYDSHLKTCGQNPQSVAASKKKQTPKNLLSKESVLVEKPSPNTSICPVLVPSKNDAEDGMWNLSLDKAPTPGVNLMLFVPVCSQSDSLPLSSSISANFGMDTFVVGQIAPTVNLVTSNMVEECEAPLDLSQRSAVGNTPLGTVRKPLKVDVTEEGHSIQRQDFKNGDSKVTSNVKPEEADNGTAEILKSEPTDLTSSEMILDVKTEPEHQASGLYPSTTHNLTRYQPDKEIKMEVDISP
ncbi:zinc finger protein 502 [Cynoglossus semilaevis]|uniref:Zinc finger protein 502-like n=1 Tax=Cynoglossus semilaevis TaxID=244447 RepID=A0A3P8V800_CYNSE|nr:zinc finger protein 502-like [Cynoglossus semilaevis]XP_016893221.1 zinc finger protein 502-like [Cynoglossus semilaevis]